LPRQFRHVRVFLLRHDRRAGAEAVGNVDEADARAHPDDQLFRHARHVHHDQRGGGGEFDGEVAVGDGVQRVVADVVEAQRLGHAHAVDREGGAGQRGGAQRQAVDALAGVGHALGVAAEHFHVGQHVVAEGDRLRHLHVGEAGQDGVGVLFGQVGQRAAQGVQQLQHVVDGRAHVQADVGGHLVVARTAGVQALAGVADQLGQAFFDVQVDVFQVEQPFELAGVDFGADLRHAALDLGAVLRADDALGGQHFGVGQRALDVGLGQALVEEYRGGVAFDEVRDGLAEAGRPGFGLFGEL
jgi:hypothetical protein